MKRLMFKVILTLGILLSSVSQVGAQQLANDNLTILSDTVSFPVRQGLIGFAVTISGTFSQTITFECRTTINDLYTTRRVIKESDGTLVTTTTAGGTFLFANNGYQSCQARTSSFSSGTAVVRATIGYATSLSAGGSSGGGGSGDASLSEQQSQTALLTTINGFLTTIDADTSILALLSKREDDAHTNNDPGIPALVYYNGTNCSSLTIGGVGDYGLLPIASVGTSSGLCLAGLVAEDSVLASATLGWGVFGERRDTPTANAANGDWTAFGFDSVGNLWVSGTVLEDQAEVNGMSLDAIACIRRDTAASSSVSNLDIVTINCDSTGRVWTNTELPDAAVLADATATPTVPGIAAYNMCYNGSTWDMCRSDQTGSSVNYHTSNATTEDETQIKATAGRLFSVTLTNVNAAVRYFRCYNLTAANTTPGTSTVFLGEAIPGNTAGAGITFTFGGAKGIAFDTALTCTLTTGQADTDVAEVAANEIKWTLAYE